MKRDQGDRGEAGWIVDKAYDCAQFHGIFVQLLYCNTCIIYILVTGSWKRQSAHK